MNAETIKADVKNAAETIGTKLSDAAGAARETAGEFAGEVKDRAIDRADAAREMLSDVGDRLAASLQDSLSGQDNTLKSRMMNSVAESLQDASAALRQRSVAELTDDLRVMARRHPGAFMAAAAVAGFCAARFLRASARRGEYHS